MMLFLFQRLLIFSVVFLLFGCDENDKEMIWFQGEKINDTVIIEHIPVEYPEATEGFAVVKEGNYYCEFRRVEVNRQSMDSSEREYHSMCTKCTVPYRFEISKYEVTVRDFVEIMGSGESKEDEFERFSSCEKCAIKGVNWYEAVTYCNVRSLQENLEPCYLDWKGDVFDLKSLDVEFPFSYQSNYIFWADPQCSGYRLPTLPEWDVAAKGGDVSDTIYYLTRYPGEDNPYMPVEIDYNIPEEEWPEVPDSCGEFPKIEEEAWWCGSGINSPMPVGLKQPNSIGLYDMLGNVSEWVWTSPYAGPYREDTCLEPDSDFSNVIEYPSNARCFIDSNYRSVAWNVGMGNVQCTYSIRSIDKGIGFRLVRTLNPIERR